MSTVLSPSPLQKFWTNNGQPLSFGTVTTYAAGSTTPIATYVDSTGITTNSNPITLNSRGECSLWLLPNTAYKYLVQDNVGNTISTTDNIVGSVQVNLYGGVDTGAVNAYVLNYAANYSTLSNGIIIYWTPANTNTGPSTIAVNGLGVVPILNQNGSPLGSGQIVSNAVTAIFYFNGNWYLTSSTGSIPAVGTFTGSLVSGPNSTAVICTYELTGNQVVLSIPYSQVTASGGALSLINLPVFLQPPNVPGTAVVLLAQNNGAVIGTALGVVSTTGNAIGFYLSASDYSSGGGSWTGLCSIGVPIPPAFHAGQTITWGLF